MPDLITRIRALRRELDALYEMANAYPAQTESSMRDWAKISLAIDEAEQQLEVAEKAVEQAVEQAEREAEAQ